jgi:uncharacterized membrane protein YedE/YeeE
LLYRFVDQ